MFVCVRVYVHGCVSVCMWTICKSIFMQRDSIAHASPSTPSSPSPRVHFRPSPRPPSRPRMKVAGGETITDGGAGVHTLIRTRPRWLRRGRPVGFLLPQDFAPRRMPYEVASHGRRCRGPGTHTAAAWHSGQGWRTGVEGGGIFSGPPFFFRVTCDMFYDT